jgi:hypothetical protein
MTDPVLPATVSEALERMISEYAEALNADPALLVHVAIGRRLASRIDHESDGSKLSALIIRLRMTVDTLGVAAGDTDEFDEIAARRREHERNGYGSAGAGDAEGA